MTNSVYTDLISCETPLLNNNVYKDVRVPPKLSWKFKIAYGVGHVLNDVCSAIWFTYLLLFLRHVIEFNESQAGLILLIGQIADAVANPFVGYVSDQRDTHWLCLYGKRKIWHIIGTVLVIISFPVVFFPALGSTDGTSADALLFYYAVFTIVFQFAWASIQISHLSLIPEVTTDENERTALAAMRYRFTVLATLFVYVVAWLIMGSEDGVEDTQLTKDDASKFQQIVVSGLVFGIICTIFFHCYVTEKEDTQERREGGERDNNSILSYFRNIEYYKVAIVYMSTMLFVNLTQIYIPIYMHETLKMPRFYLAVVPLCLFLGSFVASLAVEKMNKVLGRKISYVIGAVIGLSACTWMHFRSSYPSFVKWEMIPVAILIGIASGIVLVTNLAVTADLIGEGSSNNAFIYSLMTVTDKVANGVIVFTLQHLYFMHANTAIYENVLVYICGLAIIVATISLMFIRKEQPVQRREEYIMLP